MYLCFYISQCLVCALETNKCLVSPHRQALLQIQLMYDLRAANYLQYVYYTKNSVRQSSHKQLFT